QHQVQCSKFHCRGLTDLKVGLFARRPTVCAGHPPLQNGYCISKGHRATSSRGKGLSPNLDETQMRSRGRGRRAPAIQATESSLRSIPATKQSKLANGPARADRQIDFFTGYPGLRLMPRK